jgi:uncharacterized membrane protein YedE/YeeE
VSAVTRSGFAASWKAITTAAASGLLFGAGLCISGMTRVDKVINFLDLADGWDPSLAFVMGGAIAVHWVLFRLILRRKSPLFRDSFGIPKPGDIDMRLIGGSALFGVGWAIGGFCPGPGLVSAASLAPQAMAFVASLTTGMLAFQLVERSLTPKAKLVEDA